MPNVFFRPIADIALRRQASRVLAASLLLSISSPMSVPAWEQLATLVGHCWSAKIDNETADRHCFSTLHRGMHIKDEHAVTKNEQQVYSGETIYSVEKRSLTFTYVSSIGGIGRGMVTRDGARLQFRMSMRATPDEEPTALDTTWFFHGDGYDVITADGRRKFHQAD